MVQTLAALTAFDDADGFAAFLATAGSSLKHETRTGGGIPLGRESPHPCISESGKSDLNCGPVQTVRRRQKPAQAFRSSVPRVNVTSTGVR